MNAEHTNTDGNIKRVQIALILTGAFMIVEVIGGILSGSLALLADAGHMLTDTMSLALAAFAFEVSSRPADSRRSYGDHQHHRSHDLRRIHQTPNCLEQNPADDQQQA